MSRLISLFAAITLAGIPSAAQEAAPEKEQEQPEQSQERSQPRQAGEQRQRQRRQFRQRSFLKEWKPGTTMVRPGQFRPPDFPAPSILDYKPESTLVTEEHDVPSARYPTVDIHSHHRRPMTPERMASLVAEMDKLNLRTIVDLSGGSGESLRKDVEAVAAGSHGDRFRFFANVAFEDVGPGFGERAAAQLDEDIRNGAIGLKIGKSLGLRVHKTDGTRLQVDDPELDPIWQTCARHDVPVLIHTAEPMEFFEPIDFTNERWLELALFDDRRYPDGEFPRFDELLEERTRMFARHPKTKFIAAHFGYYGHDLARGAKALDELPNLNLDISAVLYEFGRQPRAARKFFIRYQDRLLFGKDSWQPIEFPYYWRVLETADEYFDYYRDYHASWKLYGLELPDEVLKKVYYQNAVRLTPGLPQTGWPE